ncbi:MAG: cation transporter [Candidatus Kapaibacterium sp.]|nr:MAG: cation transporter [Candidatus Kapabacteria bacterium]
MTRSFAIPGMTCSGCERTVTRILSGIEGITAVTTELQPYSRVEITMTKHLETEAINAELGNVAKGRYVLLPDTNGVRNKFHSENKLNTASPTCASAE